jgi:hypothetical protein
MTTTLHFVHGPLHGKRLQVDNFSGRWETYIVPPLPPLLEMLTMPLGTPLPEVRRVIYVPDGNVAHTQFIPGCDVRAHVRMVPEALKEAPGHRPEWN